MTRPEMLNRLRSHTAEWDIIIVGSDATGVGWRSMLLRADNLLR